MRRAVLDIGSNTVKLMVADRDDHGVTPVFAGDVATRLAEGVHESGQLAPAPIRRTVDAIRDYLDQARSLGAESVQAVTTSAVRQADNPGTFLAAVREATGLEVEIISGEREAELIYRGVASDPHWTGEPLVVVDVGGGSVEFIQGNNSTVEQLVSLPLGAVRLHEQFGESGFPAMCEHLRRQLFDNLSGYARGRRLVGTGGTMVNLARVLHASLHGVAIDYQPDHQSISDRDLRGLLMHLNAMPLAERRIVPAMPADRADIIVGGGMVLVCAMEALGTHEINVSTRNLRYGVIGEPHA